MTEAFSTSWILPIYTIPIELIEDYLYFCRMELPRNIKTRLRLRIKLWERKIEDLKKDEKEYGASFTREELQDKETREKYGTKMTAYKYAILKLRKEVETWKQILKGQMPSLPSSSPDPSSAVETLEPASS